MPDSFTSGLTGNGIDCVTVTTGAGSNIYRQRVNIDNVPVMQGAWSYYAGTAGTVTLSAGQVLLGLTTHSTSGGTLTIGPVGTPGPSIPIIANTIFNLEPYGNITAADHNTLIFSGTDSYMVEVITPGNL